MRGLAVIAGAVLLAGCGTSDVLPAGGAGGGAELRFWDAGRGRPVVVMAREVVSRAGRIDDLELRDVDIRLPLGRRTGPSAERDLACIHAASARIETGRDGQRTIHLAGPDGGPIPLAGAMQGRAFLGHARRVRIDAKTRTLVAEEVELVRSGGVLRAPRMEAVAGGPVRLLEGVSVNDDPPRPAAVLAAAAAMPAQLAIPEP